MKNKVLVFTSSFDKTCDYIISKYKDTDFFRCNYDNFSLYRVSVSLDGFYIEYDNNYIDASLCKAIYFRKPVHENLDNIFEKKYHNFAIRESYSLIEGIAESFSGICLSKPSIMRSAGNKVKQVVLAKEVGFIIPRMLITNDSSSVNELKESELIVKPLAVGVVMDGDKKEFVQTNLINSDLCLDSLKYTPAYFQEYIEKEFDVRVTFVGKKAFSVKILSSNKVDWRKPGAKLKYEICEIPDSIYEKCLEFLNLCEMQFGCFDFIVNKNVWYFLEMNSNGQWAWLEFETGMCISKEIVGILNGI